MRVKTFCALTLVGCAFALLSACGGSDEPPQDESPGLQLELRESVLRLCPLPEVAQMRMDTENGETIRPKDEGYINASFAFSGTADAAAEPTASGRVRGRGNSTWHLSPKKPYTLNLSKKTSLLGMAGTKKWSMLANYGDKTMLRTTAAMCMARILDLPYTPELKYVELTLNDAPQGLYQLTHKTYPVEEKVKDESKLPPSETDLLALNDPFLLEVHWYLPRELNFQTSLGMPLQFRSEPDEAQFDRIVAWFAQFEALISDVADPQRYEKVQQQMDVRSLIDMFLVNELIGNHDAFLFSTHMFRFKNGLLTWGPAWDFDQSSGLTEVTLETDAWMLPFRTPPYNAALRYFELLLDFPEFDRLLQERWQHLHQHMPALQWVLQQHAQAIDAAQQRNFEIWPILGEQVFTNVVAFDTYEEEVDYLLNWLDRRDRWIDANIQDLPTMGH